LTPKGQKHAGKKINLRVIFPKGKSLMTLYHQNSSQNLSTYFDSKILVHFSDKGFPKRFYFLFDVVVDVGDAHSKFHPVCQMKISIYSSY